MKNKILSLLIIIFVTANAGLCEQTRTVAVQDLAIKFILAMAGVIVSSLMIYGILAIYNRIVYGKKRILTPEEEILHTPKTTDEAIQFFIRKNRL